ncbi:uncharacterized protein Z519_01600 [Cladophialophora bantiana CBS 173.52]|uniref:Uncharacterized protein n=1 Tax=Cladophialophora bantiana (strain ATCC 10958 / CBS 173.52 / CDC B-1940 / NIH 8579) TaxID=1442370 RepID=A0A0D2F7H6_CLAB1|nr:uncharacterized protein Z519_01600 [Cladophialophora bantiana CBS 173.52]KIW98016.1 hypothetical protein Z519_01600 [Cladophialophora bantiana CBS 173.52]
MYWKSCYQKAESERLKLVNELARLRQERDSLLAGEEAQRSKGPSAVGKRKRETPVFSTRKALQTARQQKINLDLDDDDIDLTTEGLNVPLTDRQSFLHGFISLRHSLRLADPNQETLVNAVRASAIPISRILEKYLGARRNSHAKQEDQSIKDICAAFRNVYPSVLQGVDRIQPQTGEGGEQYYPALSDVIKVFQAFLGQLHKFALNENHKRKLATKAKRRGSAPTREIPIRGFGLIGERDEAKVKDIIRTLLKMITALDVSSDAQCELLEGYLCTMLDHVGSSLSLLVFTDSTGISKEQPGLLAPRGLLDVAHIDGGSAVGTATVEGPYLIWILRKAMDFLLANTKEMSEKSQLLFAVQECDSKAVADDKGLRRRIEETLQNTLLRGVFGDDDDSFYNSLRREDEGEENEELMKMTEGIKKTECSPEWFIGEVWEHLGWDILSGRRGA